MTRTEAVASRPPRGQRVRRIRVEPDGSARRWPGAAGGFALLGEVLWVGILVTIASLPILTLPGALAAGTRSLRRYLRAERSGVVEFRDDLARAVLPGLVVGLAAVGLVGLGVASAAIALGYGLPGGEMVAIAALALVGAASTVTLALAATWRPAIGWSGAARGVLHDLAADASGTALLVVAIVLTGVCAWQYPPLIVPALGCLAFAAAVVVERRIVRAQRLDAAAL
ncbi:MAG: hypothetical protein KJ659_10100 [Actinobacteria bacterium]|nr:hypothetical protein [Actinomycetota bacterium]MBU1608763.1 hypothetical protein [Actinomycetota bacterium]MBU2316330.1 hypothetical protein [Actinomycetota bacterium]MBU2385824.1 hypothetical protein [Actinomycetota bacterium]